MAHARLFGNISEYDIKGSNNDSDNNKLLKPVQSINKSASIKLPSSKTKSLIPSLSLLTDTTVEII